LAKKQEVNAKVPCLLWQKSPISHKYFEGLKGGMSGNPCLYLIMTLISGFAI
jgi:hypothetical protein